MQVVWNFPSGSDSKESACNAGDLGLIPGSRRYPGKGNGNPLQHSCLENSMDRGAWQATVQGSQRVGHDWVTNTYSCCGDWIRWLEWKGQWRFDTEEESYFFNLRNSFDIYLLICLPCRISQIFLIFLDCLLPPLSHKHIHTHTNTHRKKTVMTSIWR